MNFLSSEQFAFGWTTFFSVIWILARFDDKFVDLLVRIDLRELQLGVLTFRFQLAVENTDYSSIVIRHFSSGRVWFLIFLAVLLCQKRDSQMFALAFWGIRQVQK